MTSRLAFSGPLRYAAGLASIVAILAMLALTAQLAFAGQTNVDLAKVASDDLVDPGQAFTYTLTADVTALNVTGLLVRDTTLDNPQMTVTGATWRIDSGGTTACAVVSNIDVTCTVGSVSVGQNVIVVINAQMAALPNDACANPNGSGTLDTTIRNTGEVQWTDTDGTFSEPSPTVVTDINCSGSTLPTPTPTPSVTPTPTPTGTPTPTPTPTPSPSSPFTDISTSQFKNDIIWAYNEGITSGCTSTRFCPNSNVTRDQMASFLDRALGLPTTSLDFFTDDEGNIHEGAINRLAAAGITGGCATGRFCPKATVKRDQMASFLVRAYDLPASSTDPFTDDEGNQHENQINALAASGITGGCAANRYCPTASVTRGQMAAFLHRADPFNN